MNLDRVIRRLYKKGAEVRLVVESPKELAEIRRLLKRAGFKLGGPFAKAEQFWRKYSAAPARKIAS